MTETTYVGPYLSTVWYRYTPAAGGPTALSASAFGSQYLTRLTVYAGETMRTLREIACSRNPFAGPEVAFEAEAGQTYYIQIDAQGGDLSFALDGRTMSAPHTPSFTNYQAPHPWSAGETSIGVNRTTGAVMMSMGRGGQWTTVRVAFDDTQTPATALWTNVPTTSPLDVFTASDPILWTDPVTGRTLFGQIGANTGVGGVDAGIISYTDDDGETWHPTEPAVSAPSYDHDTIGGGPYATAIPGRLSAYPNAVYYCAITPSNEQCARSDDGGLAWGAPFSMPPTECSPFPQGHVVVAPNGSVVVPHGACLGDRGTWAQGVVVSEDNGVTWKRRTIAGSHRTASATSVAFDSAGRMYFATTVGGAPSVATSDDGGESWSPILNIGESPGVHNAQFPMVIAGDVGRAAFAYYGTTTAGDDQDPSFAGAWHLYVASTFDGGATWSTIDATPNDPVQRGDICVLGSACTKANHRNLADYQGIAVDAEGRVLVSYADGCTTAACVGPAGTPADVSHDSYGPGTIATIARQSAGKRLFAQFDPPGAGDVGLPGTTPPAPSSCTPSEPDCMPTTERCSDGDLKPYWDGGAPGRGAMCVASEGRLLFYQAGRLFGPFCGVLIIADKMVYAFPADPNLCP
jgi:hypothetical protein